MGRWRLLKHGAQTDEPCGQSGRRPRQGTEREGRVGGGGADGFIVGWAEKLFDVYSRHQRQRRNSGTRAMSLGKQKEKKEPGTIYMQPCVLWHLDGAREAAGASLTPTRQLGKDNNNIQDWTFVAARTRRSQANLYVKAPAAAAPRRMQNVLATFDPSSPEGAVGSSPGIPG